MVFSIGDACSCMLFIDHGFLDYELDDKAFFTQNNTSSRFVRPGSCMSQTSSKRSSRCPTFLEDLGSATLKRTDWLCEIALFTTWQNVGNLQALSSSLLLSVDGTALAKVSVLYPAAL